MSNLSSFWTRLKNGSFQRKSLEIAGRIESFEKNFAAYTGEDFKKKSSEFKLRISYGEPLRKFLPEAFALVRCAARFLCGNEFDVCGIKQKWEMVPYRVQLQAAIALSERKVAEVATGEGKTLIAVLPAYLYSLYGEGCHIATVNEYLARRDSQWMRPLYSLLGLSCACVCSGQSLADKKSAYAADITYGTSAEFGFDYLRDNSSTHSPAEKVQRGFFFCLVDEADSILIDEARTPLIISGDGGEDADGRIFADISPAIAALAAEQNRICNDLARRVLEKIGKGTTPDSSDIENLVRVKIGTPRSKLLKKILKTGSVNLALEKELTALSTNLGIVRMHKLRESLLYYVDEKNNGVSLTRRGELFLRPDNGRAFVIGGEDAKSDFAGDAQKLPFAHSASSVKNSGIRSSVSSEEMRAIQQLLRAYALYERDVDYIVRGGKIEIIDSNTGRVMEGRRWSDGLHQAIEAKEGVKIEAENITYATVSIQNYFRMYRYLAGMSGTAKELSDEFSETYSLGVVEIPSNRPCVRKDNPDMFFLTRLEKFEAIASIASETAAHGRPVLIGTGSVEDSEILSRMFRMRRVPHNLLNAKNDVKEALLVSEAGGKSQITISTSMAGRGTDIKLGEGVEALGGLLIIAAEHFHSKRIDRQLMGRCARQGDRGETLFVVSLEDELLRKYADLSPFEKVIKTKCRRGCPISHPLLGRIVSGTQNRVEGDYSGERKSMLKFDNPSNRQRGIVYGMRDEIMSGKSVDDYLSDAAVKFAAARAEELLPHDDWDISSEDVSNLVEGFGLSAEFWDLFDSSLRDWKKTDIVDGIGRAFSAKCTEVFSLFPQENSERVKIFVLLKSLDASWRRHITRLEELRKAVFLRGYAQKDPYCEFEKEAFASFENFLAEFGEGAVASVCGFLQNMVSGESVRRKFVVS